MTETWPLFVSLLLAALGGSLHCVGMCGPILLAFSQSFGRSGKHRVRDFACYHAGRIWTYSMLGVLAGLLNQRLQQGAGLLGIERPVALTTGVMIVLGGAVMIASLHLPRVSRFLHTCGAKMLAPGSPLAGLVRMPGAVPRLMLGMVMGLIPCGLVYGALAIASAMPTPWHAGAGMLVFGLGTLPSLASTLIAAKLVPARWRPRGMQFAGIALLLAGSWIVVRASLPPGGCHGEGQACCEPAHAAAPLAPGQ